MPIYLHLKKLQERFHLRGSLLPSNHIIKSIIGTSGLNKHITLHYFSLNKLTHKQWLQLHSPLINMDDKYNKFLFFFSPFDKEFSPGKRLIDFFLDNIFFHMQKQDIKSYLCNLDNITISTFIDPHSIMVILDTSILWDAWTLTILFFWFSFLVYFILPLDDEEACDTAVTWHVT